MRYSNFIRKDYKSRDYLLESDRPRRRHPWLRWSSLAIGLAVLGVVMGKSRESTLDSSAATHRHINTEQNALRLELPIPGQNQTNFDPTEIAVVTSPVVAIPANSTEPPVETSPQFIEKTATVKPGDTLSGIFTAVGASHNELAALLQTDRELGKLFPGNVLNFGFDDGGQLQQVQLHHNESEHTEYRRTENGFVAERKSIPLEVRLGYAQSEIRQSLFLTGKEAGISENMIMDLAFIFGWDIDFALDVREGDRFSLVYEQLFRDGTFVREGNILAAEFVNQGNVYRAIRFSTPDGRTDYFSPDGKTLRKAFLRSPLNFTRISSGFTTRRYHPVLHKFRAHRGVDYAAPRGTPVWSTGDGKVIFKGKKGGYGNTIVIKHGAAYSTLYAHLNNFAKGIQTGGRVTQNQIIGYVGSTGLATGPHLHYEFQVNGVHRNPLTVKFPGVEPIAEAYRSAFEAAATPLLAQLDSLSRINVAQQ